MAGTTVRTGSVTARPARRARLRPGGPARPGRVPLRPIAENITLTATDRLGRHGFFTTDSLTPRAGSALMRRLDVKAEGPDQPVSALSGGNQQKVVMGRALASDPKALVLIRPTAGVDVKSKESLLGTVRQVADGGLRRAAGLRRAGRPADRAPRPGDVPGRRGRASSPGGWTDTELIAAIEGLRTGAAEHRGRNERKEPP